LGSHSAIDWDAAFAYYAALGSTRTFRHVREHMGVGQRTVERAAIRLNWKARIAEHDREVAAQVDRTLVRDRSLRVADTLRIIDASRLKFAANLREQTFRLTGSDFVGLIKLEQLLEGEATDRVSVVELQEAIGLVMAVAIRYIEKKDQTVFLNEVRGRIGTAIEAKAAA